MTEEKPHPKAPTSSAGLSGDSFEDDMLDSMERELLQEFPSPNIVRPSLGAHIDGRFVLEEELGAGGMGWVFAARHLATGGQVALKVMNPRVGASGKQRFAMEARNAAMLTHPNTVRVLDYGQDGEHLFLVMEFLKGDSLDKVIKALGRLSLERTVLIAAQVLKSLWEAHDHQIVHRDIKAGNIFLSNQQGTQDFVKVVDFGISSNLKAPLGVTQGIIGSPYNMAPEQWEGEDVTPHTDLYAVGCLAYEMLSGQVPFYSNSLATLGVKHLKEAPVFDHLRFADSSIPLHGWIKRMMAKAPEDRPQSAKHALQELQDAVQMDLAISPRPPASLRQMSTQTLSNAPALMTASGTRQEMRHNLPHRQGRFIGRAVELSGLSRMLVQEGSRLVTVVGLGGVGKTSLIREFAQQTRTSWPGEVWFCDLTKVTSRKEFLFAITQAMDIKLTEENQEQQFVELLKARPKPLLLLDNFEQITHLAPDSIATWMAAVPFVTFLVSSREPLAIVGEKVLRLLPFALPSAGDMVEDVAGNDAITVFMEKAVESKPGFALTPENLQDMITLVRQLDGLPLALKMAAARVSVLTPAQIVQRLSQRFKLLRSQRADLSPHQTTLKNTLDWSWEMLLPWEKEGLIQCSVFHGSFTLEAAEAVLDLSAWPDAPWTLDLLQNLLDKSWLTTDPQEDQQQTRFTFYVSIREYALYQQAQKAQGSSEEEGVVSSLTRRHAEYYGGLPLDCAVWERNFNPQKICNKEHDNLLVVAEGPHRELAYRAALALAGYYTRYGLYRAAINLLHPWFVDPPEDPHQHVRIVLTYAFINMDMGTARQEWIEQARDLAHDLGETVLEGWALQVLGVFHGHRDRELSVRFFREAVEVGVSTGDRKLQGWASMSLGSRTSNNACFEQALVCARHANALVLECVTHRAFAVSYQARGKLDVATDHYLRALEINTVLGWQDIEGWLLRGLSTLYHLLGDHNKAYQTIRQCMKIAVAIGHQRLEGWSCLSLGTYYIHDGKRSKALEVFTRGLRLAEAMNSKQLQSLFLCQWAMIDLHSGDVDAAHERINKSIASTVSREGNSWGLFVASRATIQHALGQYELARQDLAEAEAIFEVSGGHPRSLFGRRLKQARNLLATGDSWVSATE